MDARPHGIALALLVIFALGLTAATTLFLGFAALMVHGMFAPQGDEPPGAGLLLAVALISGFVGSAFAWVAAAVWRVVIGPRRHSHA